MSSLDPRTTDKLVKLLGMLGSEHAGERATAAAKADRLVRDAGLTWKQVVGTTVTPAPSSQTTADDEPPADMRERARWLLSRQYMLNEREHDFVVNVAGSTWPLSDRQARWLDSLVERARAGRSA